MGLEAMAIAGIIGAVASAGGTAYSAYAGQKQQATQDMALKRQQTAQQTAEGAALSTERQGEIAQSAANAKVPDISAILARASQMSKGGVGGTMLTGPQGVDPGNLNLGKTSLLGS